ncbi:hypothetical protein GCM10025791_49990 [Halioxenophilus aromaticivorans]|uniref:Uncharacterized protein n=1 Tax=Halioxenophilus aromaticivorans TaxID=1306992 RepID=A0AAV3UAH9_9ALTE
MGPEPTLAVQLIDILDEAPLIPELQTVASPPWQINKQPGLVSSL